MILLGGQEVGTIRFIPNRSDLVGTRAGAAVNYNTNPRSSFSLGGCRNEGGGSRWKAMCKTLVPKLPLSMAAKIYDEKVPTRRRHRSEEEE
jgi:hypothetical protein